MIETGFLRELERVVGPANVSAGRTDAEVYSYDGSLAHGVPEAIVFPADSREAAAVIGAAAKARVPCTPRGFGTNLSGGSVTPRGGIVLCFTRMNRILAIETERRCAIVQPGVTNLELQEALAPLGFFYAPDPASQKVATLGGNVGENSGGPHCLKYGVTTNHILGMEIVLSGGELVRVGGPALDPPGPDLRGLLVGAEGTLGAVTEITVRIMPRPESVITLLAVYDDVADAARSVSGIVARGIVPATLEMMDAPVMNAVEDSIPCGYPRDAAAVLIIEVEGPVAGLRDEAGSVREICTAKGCRSIREAKDDAERNQLWAGRRGAFGAIARIAPNYLVNDCTVPRTRLPEALAQVAAIVEKHGISHGNVFHAGDGNLHPLLFFDGRDADQSRRVKDAGWEIMEACVALGGTISGEHGIGMEKIDAMRMVFSEDDLDFQRAVRRAFDPDGSFNPEKVVPESGQSEITARPPNRTIGDASELVPADEDEVREMVAGARAEGVALLPVGAGRRADFGNANERQTIPLRSEKLSALGEHDPDNQVVVAGAGMRLAELQERLSARNQWLPVRPPLANGCTLGGLVALGACGPERHRYGAPRDLLLGLRFVSGRGRLISAGGKVVKNVAGYDVTRLMTGSAGTLGFFTGLTFRIMSRPEVCRVARAQGPLDRCAAFAGEVLRSNLEPVFVSAMPADERNAWAIAVGFEGFDVTVRSQSERCSALMEKAGLGPEEPSEYAALAGFHAKNYDALLGSPFVLRADLPPDLVAGFIEDAAEAFQGATLFLDFGCGRITAGIPDLSGRTWTQLCELAQKARGHVLLEKTPPAFKQDHDVFGSVQPAWAVMHKLKDLLDPDRVFAPGRMPGRK